MLIFIRTLLFDPEANLLHTQVENEVSQEQSVGAEYFKILTWSS